jgi:hypothetical protein
MRSGLFFRSAAMVLAPVMDDIGVAFVHRFAWPIAGTDELGRRLRTA